MSFPQTKKFNKALATSLFLVSLLSIFLSACNQPPNTTPEVAASDPTKSAKEDLIKHFNDTIRDAAVYQQSNIRELFPLKFDPTNQIALVVTFTTPESFGCKKPDGSACKVGDTDCVCSSQVWVTAVPEVKDKCKTVTTELNRFLNQLLGLHPNTRYTHFYTLEVKQSDIFRPAPNPDTTTKYPCPDPSQQECGEFFPDGTSDEHKIWIGNQMLSSYIIATPLKLDGYPWTRLGYTYNWKKGADKYGASEYVVRQGSTVTLKEIKESKDYCSAN